MTHVVDASTLARANEAGIALLPCGGCPSIVPCVVSGYVGDQPAYTLTVPGSLDCAGCGERFCRPCARAHPDAATCAVRTAARRAAQPVPLVRRVLKRVKQLVPAARSREQLAAAISEAIREHNRHRLTVAAFTSRTPYRLHPIDVTEEAPA